MKINSILTKLIIIIAVVEFLIMAVLYEYFKPLHLLIERYAFLGPIIDTVILVLIVTIAYFKMLKQPMDKLLKVMDAVEKKDFSMKADEKRKDELGAIARHFNKVSARLKNWGNDLEIEVAEQTRQFKEMNKELIMVNEELAELRAELEKKIEERTAELTKVNEELEKKVFELEQFNQILIQREQETQGLKVKIAVLEAKIKDKGL